MLSDTVNINYCLFIVMREGARQKFLIKRWGYSILQGESLLVGLEVETIFWTFWNINDTWTIV